MCPSLPGDPGGRRHLGASSAAQTVPTGRENMTFGPGRHHDRGVLDRPWLAARIRWCDGIPGDGAPDDRGRAGRVLRGAGLDRGRPGTELSLTITNAGAVLHDLKLDGTTGSDMIDPRETVTAAVGVIAASSQAWCTVPGHKAAGMVLDITVTGAAATSVGNEGGVGADDAAVIDFEAEPGEGWQPYDPELQPAPGGTGHELTMHAVETEIEVAPGVPQMMWTFDGTVPGTTLRGKVGDVFTITLVNDGEIGHSIDFHASKVAWNDEMRTIEPGESLVYQFEAKHAGAFMYHCGTQPSLHHIGNGMFGAIIIDPPGLPPVDHDYLFVQSELYLGPQGQPGDLAKMEDEAWDAVVFNGYVNQYRHAPIRVEPGERVRAWVVDDGPSENSSFHIVSGH